MSWHDFETRIASQLEEVMEMAGVIVFVHALLSHARIVRRDVEIAAVNDGAALPDAVSGTP